MVNTFIEFEDKHKLFERKVRGFYYWHYIRYGIFQQVFLTDTVSMKKADKPRLKDLITMLRLALFRNTWFVHKHVDILAIGYPRKIKNEDGTREDPYIEPIVRNTGHSSLTLEVYSRQFDNIDSDPAYVKFVQDTVLHSKIAERLLSSAEKQELRAEAEYIADLFSCFSPPPYAGLVYQNLRSAYCTRKVFIPKFRRLLKKTTPYCILATPGYTGPAMVLNELALERGIPTIEVEHAFFTEEAVPHNFYRKQPIKSYPQYFFANSQYKPDNVRFPIDNEHVRVVGSPYLEKRVNNRKSQMIKGEIVLLDDNKYSDILIGFADRLLNYIEKNQQSAYHITLKAHPANHCDSPAWERIKRRTDLTCITGIKGRNVYDCLEKAEIVVGVCSSTLFEAQAYGCRVCIIESDASRMMRNFVNQGYGVFVNEPQDIFVADNAKDSKTLWHPNALKTTLREIDKIIEETKGSSNG